MVVLCESLYIEAGLTLDMMTGRPLFLSSSFILSFHCKTEKKNGTKTSFCLKWSKVFLNFQESISLYSLVNFCCASFLSSFYFFFLLLSLFFLLIWKTFQSLLSSQTCCSFAAVGRNSASNRKQLRLQYRPCCLDGDRMPVKLGIISTQLMFQLNRAASVSWFLHFMTC